MALINCPECNKEISDKANSCPHCGYLINKHLKKIDRERKKIERKKIHILTEQKIMRKIIKGIPIYLGVIIIFLAVGAFIYYNSESYKYKSAIYTMKSGNYLEAIEKFEELIDYKDSKDKLNECVYEYALQYYNNGDFNKVISLLENVNGNDKVYNLTNEAKYKYGNQCIEIGEYEKGISLLEHVYGHDNVYNIIEKSRYKYGLQLRDEGKYYEAFKILINYTPSIDYPDWIADIDICVKNAYDKILADAKKLFDNAEYELARAYYYRLYAREKNNEIEKIINACEILNNSQGTWYDRYTSDYVLSIDGNTVTVDGNTNVIKNGTYNSEFKFNKDFFGEEEPALFLTDDTYIMFNYDGSAKFDGLNHITQIVNKSLYNKLGLQNPMIGMTVEEVLNSSWGKPKDINKTTYAWGTKEQWCYSDYRYIYFENGTVIAISE